MNRMSYQQHTSWVVVVPPTTCYEFVQDILVVQWPIWELAGLARLG